MRAASGYPLLGRLSGVCTSAVESVAFGYSVPLPCHHVTPVPAAATPTLVGSSVKYTPVRTAWARVAVPFTIPETADSPSAANSW